MGKNVGWEMAAKEVKRGVETVSQTQCCGGVKSTLCTLL